MENKAEISISEAQKPTELVNLPASDSTFDQNECDEKFALARRNLLCGEVPNAVNQLQDVCKTLATKFGEIAPECADAYFQYGVALLELARMENRVLGNALKGVTDIDGEEADDSFAVQTIMTEEEKEQISDQVIDAMLESKNEPPVTLPEVDVLTKISTGEAIEPEAKQESVAEAIEPEVKPSAVDIAEPSGSAAVLSSEAANELKASADPVEAVAEDEEDEGSDGEGMDQDETAEEDTAPEDTAPEGDGSQNGDEDVSNLQLSWEMLELAKTIYLKQETKEAKFKSAECLKKLGEVGLESEQYTQSIEDFKTSLEILKTCVDDATSDRRLAETHYHIAVSCVNAQLYDEAVTHFSDAILILEAKMVSLNAILNGGSETLDAQEEHVAEARKELKEIEELIPDIRLKIDDAEEEKRSLAELKKETESMTKGVTVTAGFADSDCVTTSSDSPTVQEVKPVSDVSHLVRKKRKPEESEEVEGTKKSKIDEAVNKSDEETNTENNESKENVKPIDQSDSADNANKGDSEKDDKKTDSTAATNAEDLVSLKKNIVDEPIAME